MYQPGNGILLNIPARQREIIPQGFWNQLYLYLIERSVLNLMGERMLYIR